MFTTSHPRALADRRASFTTSKTRVFVDFTYINHGVTRLRNTYHPTVLAFMYNALPKKTDLSLVE